MVFQDARAELGIVLLQLGGPESLDEVQPFLESMFGDPDLFDFPMPATVRGWLARALSQWRASKVRPLYESIEGKSPIKEITLGQAELLEESLRSYRRPCKVVVAMRYGRPTTQDAVLDIRKAGCESVLLLPLYPQYSIVTTGNSLKEWDKQCEIAGLHVPTERIESYFDLPRYIDAVEQRISEARERFPKDAPPHVLFSAHGLPRKFAEQGDPYQEQIEESVRLVAERLPKGMPHTLCYQSRIGPQRWLEPSLPETLKELGEAGTESVLVVPISFVSDHLETLSEIDIEARKDAERWGIRQFETMEGLNDSPVFVEALAELARSRMKPAADEP